MHIILVVISGIINPKDIGSKSGQRNGRVTFLFSQRRRRNILKMDISRRHVHSNWNGYFSTCKKRYGIGIVGPEKVLQEKHLPCIFFGKYKTVPPIVGYLSTFAVKTSGIRLHNTMTSEKCEYKSLLRVIFELIGAVTGKRAFSTDDRIQEVKR